MVCTVFAFSLIFALFGLLGFHLNLFCKALTTIEMDSFQGHNPFDLGVWKNLKLMMGSNYAEWLIPTKPRGRGSVGIEYEVN